MPRFQFVTIAVLLCVALGIWFAFLRPAPIRTATGVIRSKTFQPAGAYVQYQPGDRSGFQTPTTIATAENFVLGIQVEGQPKELGYALNAVAASAFEVGQAVRIEYQERGIRPFWSRVYVTGIQPMN